MTGGVLQATDVVKSYNKKEVLHGITLSIEPGKIYGLLGRNGAGKTTLLSRSEEHTSELQSQR